MSAIAPSASAMRNRILDAARDHVPLEPEDAEVLVALLDKLIKLESTAAPRQWATGHEIKREDVLSVFEMTRKGSPPPPAPIVVRLDAGNAAEASTIFRALAKALKPKKGRGR